jgi:hypothetical protein
MLGMMLITPVTSASEAVIVVVMENPRFDEEGDSNEDETD